MGVAPQTAQSSLVSEFVVVTPALKYQPALHRAAAPPEGVTMRESPALVQVTVSPLAPPAVVAIAVQAEQPALVVASVSVDHLPDGQVLHVLAPAATPPIDDLPAAHVMHWPVGEDEVPAVFVLPTVHGLHVVVVLPVGAVPPTSEVVLPVGQFLQSVAPAAASVAGDSV